MMKNKKRSAPIILSAMLLSSTLTATAAPLPEGHWSSSEKGWQYQTETGVLQNVWSQSETGDWYYFDTDGIMSAGWKQIKAADGKLHWYYFAPDGVMATGWRQVTDANGKPQWYYFVPDGAMATGWQQIKDTDGQDKWYYLNTDGSMQTGWVSQGDTTYYLNPDGAMATGSVTIGDREYPFDSSGALTGTSAPAGVVRLDSPSSQQAETRKGSGGPGKGKSDGSGSGSSKGGKRSSGSSSKSKKRGSESSKSGKRGSSSTTSPERPTGAAGSQTGSSQANPTGQAENKPVTSGSEQGKPAETGKETVREAADLLNKNQTKLVDLGWIQYAVIAFQEGTADDYTIEIDGTDVTKACTKVDHDGTIVKWESTVLDPASVTVSHRQGKFDQVALSQHPAQKKPEAGQGSSAPKLILTNGAVPSHDYYLDAYGKDGAVRTAPARTTFGTTGNRASGTVSSWSENGDVDAYLLFDHDLLANAMILQNIGAADDAAMAVVKRWETQTPVAAMDGNSESLYDFAKYLSAVQDEEREHNDFLSFLTYASQNPDGTIQSRPENVKRVLEDGFLGSTFQFSKTAREAAPLLSGTEGRLGENLVLTSEGDPAYISSITALFLDGNPFPLRSDSSRKAYEINEEQTSITLYHTIQEPSGEQPQLTEGEHTLKIEANGYEIARVTLTVTAALPAEGTPETALPSHGDLELDFPAGLARVEKESAETAEESSSALPSHGDLMLDLPAGRSSEEVSAEAPAAAPLPSFGDLKLDFPAGLARLAKESAETAEESSSVLPSHGDLMLDLPAGRSSEEVSAEAPAAAALPSFGDLELDFPAGLARLEKESAETAEESRPVLPSHGDLKLDLPAGGTSLAKPSLDTPEETALPSHGDLELDFPAGLARVEKESAEAAEESVSALPSRGDLKLDFPAGLARVGKVSPEAAEESRSAFPSHGDLMLDLPAGRSSEEVSAEAPAAAALPSFGDLELDLPAGSSHSS